MICFEIAPLGSHCAILGMPWLRCFCPSLDWDTLGLTFPQDPTNSAEDKTSDPTALVVSAETFLRYTHSVGPRDFGMLLPPSQSVHLAATSTEEEDPRDSLPPQYHEFHDMFSKASSEVLPKYHAFDHWIPIEEGKQLPFGPIYQLSMPQLETLHVYIDDDLKNRSIMPSQSPAAIPILFVKKKDGSL